MAEDKGTQSFHAGGAGDMGDGGEKVFQSPLSPGVAVVAGGVQHAQHVAAAEATVIRACRDILSAHPEFKDMEEPLRLSKIGGALGHYPDLMKAVRERHSSFGAFVAQHKQALFAELDDAPTTPSTPLVPPCESVREAERRIVALLVARGEDGRFLLSELCAALEKDANRRLDCKHLGFSKMKVGSQLILYPQEEADYDHASSDEADDEVGTNEESHKAEK